MKLDDKSILILLTVRNAGRFGDLPPTVLDLQKATLLSAGGTHARILELVRNGYITRKRLARSIQLTDKGKQYLESEGMK
jgi:DNA-binding MarR family transcriptional regulator